jgi:transketolase|tara:strand:+ start:1561 stop:2508 length:948 start_codon:yes stop_codon:yes gene_type:complete
MQKNYLDFDRSKNNQYMRDVFIDGVYEYAKNNPDIYFTTPDMGAPSLDNFRKKLPNQFIHSGICEQHMVAMAAGLTLMNKKVICYAMAPFITSRCYEQIKCSVSAMNQPVNLVGIGVGLGYADAGPTHYTTEDIATMRVFPNIEIITPSDEMTTKKLVKYMFNEDKFRFIRLDRDVLPAIYEVESLIDFNKGYAEIIKGSNKKIVITSGYLLHKCKSIINNKYNGFTLVDLFKIKPLNDSFFEYLKEFDEIITLEEQWLDGGFGSLILEGLCEREINKKVLRFGLDQKFYFENGGRDYLLSSFGLDVEKIFHNLK